MYGLMLAQLEAQPYFKRAKAQLYTTSSELQKRSTIPQIKEKLPVIQSIQTDEFWAGELLEFETIRIELRELIKFIVDPGRPNIYTNLTDVVTGVKEGEILDAGYDFEDYRLKVNRYIEEHRDHVAIYKLRNNIPLTRLDYQSLSDILTKELGTEADYEREYEDLPFGLLVRQIAKLDRETAMKALSEYINEQALNQHQIVFVNRIIDYIVENGYIDNASLLIQPPFDRPTSFRNLFEKGDQQKNRRVCKGR